MYVGENVYEIEAAGGWMGVPIGDAHHSLVKAARDIG